MIVVVWVLVALVTLMRCLAVFRVPLTGDEAYYWEWSRHLAFGYVDHPPMVAWTVGLFAPFGTESPGVTRLGFVLCGLIATLAGAACATRLANGDRRAGAVTALAITLTPLLWLAFGSVQPDGPYLAAWMVSLWLAVRAFQTKRRLDYALLGLAMGACVLSRMFGFALVAGIALYALVPSRRYLWREGLGMSFGILAVCFAPFVWWNATHNWVTFAFTFIGRHTLESGGESPFKRFLGLYAVEAAAYSPGFFAAALYCAFRPRRPLLAYTAIPLLVLMSVLVWFEKVEIHWIFGAYASLCIAIGVEYTNLSHRKRIVWASASLVPAFFLLPLIFVAAVAPGEAYQAFRNSGSTLRNTGPFEIFTVWPLAQDVRRLAEEHNALVMTDGYGLSSTLDYDAGVKPVVIGYNWQGRESRRWYPSTRALTNPTLFVDKESLFKRPGHPLDAGRADFARQLERACGRVRVDPKPLAYSVYPGVPAREYFLTWCDDPKPDALAILRWQREPSSENERPWERVAFRSAKTARP